WPRRNHQFSPRHREPLLRRNWRRISRFPLVRAAIFRRRRVETPLRFHAELRTALFASYRTFGSESYDAHQFPVRVRECRADVRVCMENAGRRRGAGGVRTSVRRYLCADARAGSMGPAEFPEIRGAGAGFDSYAV